MKRLHSKGASFKLWMALGVGACLLLLPLTVVLALGYLDPLFGAPNGYVTVDHPYSDSVVQSDGKILALGNGNLVRLQADGTVDTGFGTNGTVTFLTDEALAVAQAPDAKIFVAGQCDLDGDGQATDIRLARLLSNGQPDPAYNSGAAACRSVNITGTDRLYVNDVSVQASGNVIVMATYMYVGDLIGGAGFLEGFDSNGNINSAFGTNGSFHGTIPNPPGGSSLGFAKAFVQADDSILVLGTVSDWRGTSGEVPYTMLMHLTSAGHYDTSFGTAGVLVYSNAALAVCRSN